MFGRETQELKSLIRQDEEQLHAIYVELDTAKQEIASWKLKAREFHSELLSLRRREKDNEAKIAGLEAEKLQLARMLEKANDRAWEALNKPPVVIPPPDMAGLATALGEAMQSIAYGPSQSLLTPEDVARKIAEQQQYGQPDPDATTFFPINEFDEFMEDESKWPTQGGWAAGTPSPPTPNQTPNHTVTPAGTVTRTDGTPLFQAGQTAPPPVGGVD